MQKLIVTHFQGDQDFIVDLNHPYLKHRETGIATATQGMAGVRVTRVNAPHQKDAAQLLHNDVDLLLRYMLRGSMKVRFSEQGEHVVSTGSAWLQPPDMTHAVLGYSKDAEYLELAIPGEFNRVDLPAGNEAAVEKAIAYQSEPPRMRTIMTNVPERFVMSHLRGDEDFSPGRRVNSLSRDLGITAATNGMVTARVGRRVPPVPRAPERRHYHNTQIQIVYLTKGWIRTEFEGEGEVDFWPGSCWAQPPRIEHAMRAYSAESCELFEVIIPSDFGIFEVDDPVADRLAAV